MSEREAAGETARSDKAALRLNDLVEQVKRTLEHEAYHYCADCRTHCRQTILAVEALKESERLRIAQSAAVEGIETSMRDILAEAEFVGDAKAPFSTWVAEKARAALAAVEQLKGKI